MGENRAIYMSRRAFFTSATFSYLNRVRVLAQSLARHHPEYERWIVVTDLAPPGVRIDWLSEGFDYVVTPYDLPFRNFASFIANRDVVEASTGVKGHMLRHMFAAGVREVIYLDPDTELYSRLEELEDLHATGKSIVLTPHLLDPENSLDRIHANEVGCLKHGIFNLGFFSVVNDTEGARFANWWAERLEEFCDDNSAAGLFVDQKWCNLVPIFFEDSYATLRHPGYNVASWNVGTRRLSRSISGTWLVNDEFPLRFMHFTKAMAVGDEAFRSAIGDNDTALQLLINYQNALRLATDSEIPSDWWAFK